MTLYQVIDAAFPPAVAPDGIDGVLGYLDSPKATHAWTLAEWQRFAHVRQFPAWVADLAADPMTQAAEAVRQARALGWAAHLAPPAQTRAIVLDMETSADRTWYARAAAGILAGGFVPYAYGSLSTVLDNAADDNIVAEWNNLRVIPFGQDIHGHQYAAGVSLQDTQVDYSVFDDQLISRGGVGPRR